MTTQYEYVQTDLVDGVYVLTLNRPAKLNAITVQLELDWLHALAEAEAEPEARVIVQRGNGRVFSAGHDLAEVGAIITELGADADDWQHVYDRIWPEGSALDLTQRLTTPVVSAVHGHVVGQVVFQVLATDIVVAAAGSVFNLEVMRTGGAAGAAALVGLIPAKQVNELAYLGRLSAEDLHRVGSVNRVVPAEQLDAEAMSIAGAIARMHPDSVSAYKKAFTERLHAQRLAEFADGFDAIKVSHGNEADNEFWAMAAKVGVKQALAWRDAGFGPAEVPAR